VFLQLICSFFYKNDIYLPNNEHFAEPNTFYKWLQSKGKLGGQHKVPRLSNDREYVDAILEVMGN
jgi:hypothetical protein